MKSGKKIKVTKDQVKKVGGVLGSLGTITLGVLNIIEAFGKSKK